MISIIIGILGVVVGVVCAVFAHFRIREARRIAASSGSFKSPQLVLRYGAVPLGPESGRTLRVIMACQDFELKQNEIPLRILRSMPINNYIVKGDEAWASSLRLNLPLLIMMFGVSMSTFGQVAIPLNLLNLELGKPINENVEREVNAIKAIGDQLFVGTTDGLWLVNHDGMQARHISGVEGTVTSIKAFGNRLFVTTISVVPPFYIGAGETWIVSQDGTRVDHIKEIEGGVNDIETFGNQLFLSNSEGLWALSGDGKSAKRIMNVEGSIYSLQTFDNHLFIYTLKGLWTLSQGSSRAQQIVNIGLPSGAYEVFSNQLFVGTSTGLFVVNHNGTSAKQIEPIEGKCEGIEALGDKLFALTPEGLWSLSANSVQAAQVASFKKADTLMVIGDRLFVPAREGLWVFSDHGTQANQVKEVEGSFHYIKLFDDQIFIGTPSRGLWVLGRNDLQAKRIKEIKGDGTIYYLKEVGDRLFVSTSGELWMFSKGDTRARLVLNVKGYVDEEDFETLGGYVYFVPLHTLYRFDPRLRINTKLMPTGWWAGITSHLLPSNWLPSDRVQVNACYSYSDERCDASYPETFPREFSYAKADAEAMPSENRFSTAEQFRYEIDWGNNDVHYWVKDRWGNVTEKNSRYRGIPSQYFFMGVPFVLSIALVLVCFALAPKISFCHSAIMNPFLRKYLSFGSVPLLLSVFPALRRHLLRRYSAEIRINSGFSEWGKRFIYPNEDFRPENFEKQLKREKKLLLIGQSGIGKTSFFKHLAAHYTSQKSSLLGRVFPIYVPLTNYGGNSLEELVHTQLFSYGAITDEKLSPMFLERGGFLILLDGVNEIQSVADRQRLSVFVEKFWTNNYFCLSSQQSYPEIDNIASVELRPLSRENVCEFVRRRVDNKETAEDVIEKLTDDEYQLYRVPLDLELAIEILNGGGRRFLPRSRTELYEIVFSSMFSKWRENGHVDAEIVLYERAYSMIVQRDLAFDSVDNPKYGEITIDLYKNKFLARRAKDYNFRHELIRSYLGSKYFYPRWQNLFGPLPAKSIDSNWLELLKFSCETIEDSAEVQSLVYEVLDKTVRKDLVKNLFEWLKTNQPGKCRYWQSDFYTKYGELDFK
jgi:energy-coupling factor transporter ATP-binding protein EcfA2